MTEHSRRNFLRTTSIGAAAAGVAAVVPLSAEAANAASASNGPMHDGPVAAWVTNAASGEITVMAGEHELVFHDVKLARQLSQLAARVAK